MINFLKNRVRQWVRADTKIFFIGFNKCGTTAIHGFLARQGVSSVHWQQRGVNIACEIERLLPDRKALSRFLSRWTAYSDLTYSNPQRMIDGNRHFKLFHEIYPDAFFVFNDRDVDRWIASRCAHRQGEFLANSMQFYGLGREEVIEKWRQDHATHLREAFNHFAGSARFLHYRIDRDPVEKLVDFLMPAVTLDSSKWEERNVTALRQKRAIHS